MMEIAMRISYIKRERERGKKRVCNTHTHTLARTIKLKCRFRPVIDRRKCLYDSRMYAIAAAERWRYASTNESRS